MAKTKHGQTLAWSFFSMAKTKHGQTLAWSILMLTMEWLCIAFGLYVRCFFLALAVTLFAVVSVVTM